MTGIFIFNNDEVSDMIGGISGTGSYIFMYRYEFSNGSFAGGMQAAENAKASAVQPVQGSYAGVQTADRPMGKAQSAPSADAGHAESAVPDLFIRKGVDPAEYAVRMRIQYMEPEGMELPGEPDDVQGAEKASAEGGECQTCEQRRYQDGSNDMGVSFKTPTRIAPEAAGAMVRSHEQEHVTRERAKAEREDREVVSQSVTLHTDICPECGKVYISGGTTRTTTASRPEPAENMSMEGTQRRPFSAVA